MSTRLSQLVALFQRALLWLYTPQNKPSQVGELNQEDIRRWIINGLQAGMAIGLTKLTEWSANQDFGQWQMAVMFAVGAVINGGWRILRSLPEVPPATTASQDSTLTEPMTSGVSNPVT